MIRADCDAIRDDLDAFADGELRGAELRRVSQHIESCKRCAEEVEVRESLGGLIRDAMTERHGVSVPSGLAAGVVARARAESYFSLRAVASRAFEDGHWLLVGGGAVAATVVCLAVALVVLAGATTPRDLDSLSARGASLRAPSGVLYAEVSRTGGDGDVMLVQLGREDAEQKPPPSILDVGEERWLVNALSQALARRDAGETGTLSDTDRRYTEWLLDSIVRARRVSTGIGRVGALTVHRLHYVTNTEVIAKGLE
jgi:hypothetical protein